MDKKAFIKAVRNWESQTVAAAIAKEHALARYVDKNGKAPLHHCAEIDPRKYGFKVSNSIATAKVLLDAGANVIIIDDGEKFLATPLWYAIAWGKNHALARLLLETGAHPDDKEELLRHGAKPDIKAKDRSTPISLAHATGKSKLISLLRSFRGV